MRPPRRALGAILLALSSGCAASVRGFITPGPPAEVHDLTGESWPLRLPGDAAALRDLDGHNVEVSGVLALGRLSVREWRVMEGRHGLPVWVGPLSQIDGVLALADHNSGVTVLLRDDANGVLGPHIGEWVLVEGYVDGAQVVRVVHFRVIGDVPGQGSRVDTGRRAHHRDGGL